MKFLPFISRCNPLRQFSPAFQMTLLAAFALFAMAETVLVTGAWEAPYARSLMPDVIITADGMRTPPLPSLINWREEGPGEEIALGADAPQFVRTARIR